MIVGVDSCGLEGCRSGVRESDIAVVSRLTGAAMLLLSALLSLLLNVLLSLLLNTRAAASSHVGIMGRVGLDFLLRIMVVSGVADAIVLLL